MQNQLLMHSDMLLQGDKAAKEKKEKETMKNIL